MSSTQVKAQEQQPPHDPVLLKKQQPKPTGAKKHRMINLPHLVPAVLPAGGQPQGIFSRFMSGVKNLFWPHIDLPTLDRQRQIRRADLHDALKTEIDTHLAEEGRIGKPYLRRLMSICIPLSVAGSSAMIACTKRLKDSNPTLAISINILTMLAMCQIALHLKHTQDDRIAIFMDHLDAIKDTHLVNQAVAARLKARYAHENWAGRWLANSKIDDMKAEPAAAK